MAVLRYYDQPSAQYVALPGLPGGQGPTGPAGPAGPTGAPPTATQVSLRVARGTAFTCSSAAATLVFDSIQWDTNSAYNSSTGIYTVPVAGRYRVEAQVTASGSSIAGVYLAAHLYKNGAEWAINTSPYSSATTSQWLAAQVVDTLNCVVGDTLQVIIQTLGQNIPGSPQIDMTYFTVDLLSAGVGPTGPTGPAGPSANYLTYYQTLGAPQAGSPQTITHNLNTTYLHAQAWDAVTNQMVNLQVQILNANQIQVSVSRSMPNNVNIVVMGANASPVPIAPTDLATKGYVDSRTPALPGQILTGSGIQSFTDVLGDVWVAANGVYAGNWTRARDTLHGRWYRAAAWNSVAGAYGIPMDTATRDPYGLWPMGGSATAATAPVPGVYLMSGQASCAATAIGQAMTSRIYINATYQSVSQVVSAGAYSYSMLSTLQWYMNAGDITNLVFTHAVVATGSAGTFWTFFSMDFLGNG